MKKEEDNQNTMFQLMGGVCEFLEMRNLKMCGKQDENRAKKERPQLCDLKTLKREMKFKLFSISK
jgi:hypothetical protein